MPVPDIEQAKLTAKWATERQAREIISEGMARFQLYDHTGTVIARVQAALDHWESSYLRIYAASYGMDVCRGRVDAVKDELHLLGYEVD